MERAYPLQWPEGRPRTPGIKREHSRFDVTPDRAQHEMRHEIRLMGGKNVVVTTNQRVRQDGLLYARDLSRTPDDPGVAVYFERKGERVCFCCDRYGKIWENMRAIGKTIKALRDIERWGSAEMLDRAFMGFAALPSPGQAHSQQWWVVLGIDPNTATTDDVRRAYRIKAGECHPDRGGSDLAMAELNVARDAANKAVAA